MERESDILRAVSEYLTLKKYFWFRNNTGALPTASGGFMRFGSVGSPDICVLHKGVFYALECKRKGGIQSPAQQEWEKRCKEQGGDYRIIHGLDDMKSF